MAKTQSPADALPPFAREPRRDANVCRMDLGELCSDCLRERSARRCSTAPRR